MSNFAFLPSLLGFLVLLWSFVLVTVLALRRDLRQRSSVRGLNLRSSLNRKVSLNCQGLGRRDTSPNGAARRIAFMAMSAVPDQAIERFHDRPELTQLRTQLENVDPDEFLVSIQRAADHEMVLAATAASAIECSPSVSKRSAAAAAVEVA